MNKREKIIQEFIDYAAMLSFNCSPIFTMDDAEQTLSIKVFTEDEKPVLNIDFIKECVHIFDLNDLSIAGNNAMDTEFEKYSSLFNGVAVLLIDLKEV